MVTHSIDVGYMVFVRLYSVEKAPGLPPWVALRDKTFRVGERLVAGKAAEEVWTKTCPDCK